MDAAAIRLLVVVVLGLPLVVYVWAALKTPTTKVSTPASYFIAFRQVGASPYADSSLAYAFQVATLFPFLYWGTTGQFLPAIVNAVAWGVGIALFRRCLPSILRTLSEETTPRTLHGLLGNTYSSSSVRIVATWVTIIGMLGLALGEAYWGMQVVRVLVPEDTAAHYTLVFGVLMFVLAYVWYGGTWGSMKTDMLQLVFSYLGFTLVIGFLLQRMMSGGAHPPQGASAVAAFMVLGAGLVVWARIRNRVMPISLVSPASDVSSSNASISRTHHESVPTGHAVSSPVAVEGDVWATLARLLSRATLAAIATIGIVFAWILIRSSFTLTLTNPGDPGWIGLLALAVLPLGFQFVDMSAWQRLQSISGTADERWERANRGLIVFSIESPFSWILCLALGLLIVTAVPAVGTATDKAGPLAAFPRLLLESGSAGHIIIAVTFMIAVMAVMLSTIDSVILATMYAFVADVKNFPFQTLETSASGERSVDKGVLLAGKRAAFWFIITVFALVLGAGAVLKRPDQLIGILIGFYGALLALLPAIGGMLLKHRRWAGPAVATGMLLGVLAAISFSVWGIFDPSKSWYGVFAAPTVALAIPFILSPLLGAKSQ